MVKREYLKIIFWAFDVFLWYKIESFKFNFSKQFTNGPFGLTNGPFQAIDATKELWLGVLKNI